MRRILLIAAMLTVAAAHRRRGVGHPLRLRRHAHGHPGAGDDTVELGTGDDTVIQGDGFDQIDGQAGKYRLRAVGSDDSEDPTINITNARASDNRLRIFGRGGVDLLRAGNGTGAKIVVTLDSGAGQDMIDGSDRG